MKNSLPQLGFTLAELLIALAILGVIATFTIPKILDSGTGSQSNAIALELAGTLSGAFQQYKLNNAVSASTSVGDLTPYMNYVAIDSTSTIDNRTGLSDLDCFGGFHTCIKLHNGGMVAYQSAAFNTTDTTASLLVWLDPDSIYGGSTTGPSKSVVFVLYPNSRLTTFSTCEPNTYNNAANIGCPAANTDPEYFSWGG